MLLMAGFLYSIILLFNTYLLFYPLLSLFIPIFSTFLQQLLFTSPLSMHRILLLIDLNSSVYYHTLDKRLIHGLF